MAVNATKLLLCIARVLLAGNIVPDLYDPYYLWPGNSVSLEFGRAHAIQLYYNYCQ